MLKDFIISMYNRINCHFVYKEDNRNDKINKQIKYIKRKNNASEMKSDITVVKCKVKKITVKHDKNEN